MTARKSRPLIALLLAGIALPAAAASFTGKVILPDGKPAFGAMVTVFDASRQVRETVYTAQDGSYAISTPFEGALAVRARLAGLDDATTKVTATKTQRATLNLALKPFADAQSASDALSASAFNARLPWKDVNRDRPGFISQCNYCHQLGNATTRVPRSHEEWMG